MDYSKEWDQLLSWNADITDGLFIGADGVLISFAGFGNRQFQQMTTVEREALIGIAHELYHVVEPREFEEHIIQGKQDYIVLIRLPNKARFAVMVHEQAKLELVILDVKRAIDELFVPRLAAETIFSPQPPKQDSAHAEPE